MMVGGMNDATFCLICQGFPLCPKTKFYLSENDDDSNALSLSCERSNLRDRF